MTPTLEESLAALRRPSRRPGRAALLELGLADGFTVVPSPAGDVAVAFNPAGVSAVDLADGDVDGRLGSRLGRPVFAARPPAGWDVLIGRAIERGTPGDLPVDLRPVTPFRRLVLALTAAIPRGEVRSYGQLAAGVGRPGATRAVGSAMATNPVPLIIPCHRVVRADGTLGRYSLGEPGLKARLLVGEGVAVQEKGDRGRSLGSPSTTVSTFSS